MKKIGIIAVTILCVTVLTGCSFESNEPPGEPEEKISIEVINNTDKADELNVCYFFASDSESDEWGDDHLDDGIIQPGERFTITLDRGSYDIMLKNCSDYMLYKAWGVDGNTRIEIGGDGKIPLVIVNESDFEITDMFISPSGSNDWGKDWLADQEVVSLQNGIRVFFIKPGTYDLKAVDLADEIIAIGEALEFTEYSYWTITNK